VPRYFEVIITGRQLAALVAAVALLVLVAFGLGVGVRALQPQGAATGQPLVAAALSPTPFLQPTPAPPPPTAVPTPEPAPHPTATIPPPPTERPKPAATFAAAAPAPRPARRWVQVVALGKRDQAEGVRNRVVALGYTLRQVIVQPADGKYRVRVGPFPDVESASRVAARLRAEGFGGAFVVSE
jgi:cell division protein FtsN